MPLGLHETTLGLTETLFCGIFLSMTVLFLFDAARASPLAAEHQCTVIDRHTLRLVLRAANDFEPHFLLDVLPPLTLVFEGEVFWVVLRILQECLEIDQVRHLWQG